MASPKEYRLYSFVANLYLSPLQCGLQTAHVVSELSVQKNRHHRDNAYKTWAEQDKTIIICAALNHGGVLDCYAELERINSALLLPCALFREDEVSMNGMATACGVIVPKEYYDVQFFEEATTYGLDKAVKHTEAYWEHGLPDGKMKRYPLTHAEGQFISHIKKFRLA